MGKAIVLYRNESGEPVVHITRGSRGYTRAAKRYANGAASAGSQGERGIDDSDARALGLSMLTVAQNNDKPAGCTEATVFGPFHVEGAPHYEPGADISNGARGIPCVVRGKVRGIGGELVANALMDVWQSDEEGLYDVFWHEKLGHRRRHEPR